MHRFLPFHYSWLTHLVAAHLSGLALLGGVAVATPAARAAHPGAVAPHLSLTGDLVTAKTANGQKWLMSVTADNTGGLNVELIRPAAHGVEAHVWSFPVVNSPVAFNPTTGTGTVTGGAATGRAADIALTFHAVGTPAMAPCGSGSESIYFGTLAGTATLRTGLRQGGTVGARHIRFTAAGSQPQIISDAGCVPNTPPPPPPGCLSGSLFLAPASPTSLVAGATGNLIQLLRSIAITSAPIAKAARSLGRGTLLLTRQQQVGAAPGLIRSDVASAPAHITFDTKRHVLSVSAAKHALITGSATLSGGNVTTVTRACQVGGRAHREVITRDGTARYHSPARHVLTAHTSLTPDIAAPRTVKRAAYALARVK